MAAANALNWTEPPIPVLRQLSLYVGIAKIRKICKAWVDIMENDLYLEVKINSKEEGNLDFVRSINVWHATVNELRDFPSSNTLMTFGDMFKNANSIQSLKLCGPLYNQFKLKSLEGLTSLESLVLHFGFFISSDPTTGVVREQLDYDEFYNINEKVLLKRLKRLEIIKSEATSFVRSPAEYVIAGLTPNSTQNLGNFFSNLVAPLIDTLKIFAFPVLFGNFRRENTNVWFLPLQKFLHLHSSTLRELWFPKKCEMYKSINLYNPPPKELNKLYLSLKCGDGRNQATVQLQRQEKYWAKLVSTQTSLKFLKLCFNHVGQNTMKIITDEFFCPLGWSTSRVTLNTVYLTIIPTNGSVDLDLNLFTGFLNLENLAISGNQYCPKGLNILNLEALPVELGNLYISNALVEMPYMKFFRNHKRLKSLDVSVFKSNINYCFVCWFKGVLSLRSLDSLNLCFDRQTLRKKAAFRNMCSSLELCYEELHNLQFEVYTNEPNMNCNEITEWARTIQKKEIEVVSSSFLERTNQHDSLSIDYRTYFLFD